MHLWPIGRCYFGNPKLCLFRFGQWCSLSAWYLTGSGSSFFSPRSLSAFKAGDCTWEMESWQGSSEPLKGRGPCFFQRNVLSAAFTFPFQYLSRIHRIMRAELLNKKINKLLKLTLLQQILSEQNYFLILSAVITLCNTFFFLNLFI